MAASQCTAHTKCPPGKFTKVAGSATSEPECEKCPPRSSKALNSSTFASNSSNFTSNSSNATDPCAVDTIAADNITADNITAGTGCPPGKYTTHAGLSAVPLYPHKGLTPFKNADGKFPVNNHWGDSPQWAAAPPPPGRYSKTDKPTATAIRCETCPPGWFTNFTSNSTNTTYACTAHTKCPAGKFTSEPGTTTSQPKCNPCAPGFFKPNMSLSSTCVATDPIDCNSSIILFESTGSSSIFRNTWVGWYSIGSTVNSGSGKRPLYDTLAVSRLRFSDASGRYIEYDLNPSYAGRTLLSIVQECMGSNRRNSGSSDWKAGLCRNVGKLRSSSGSFGRFSVSSTLRIGVGDGGSDSNDWALLMPLQGNANGDFNGNNVWAFGGESQANNGYSSTVRISATCSGRARFQTF